ncbi:hypothetical protein ACFL59_14765 [Planctomycetota bacterium]
MASHSLFCPFCNSKGEAQPILSPMVCAYVLDRRSSEKDRESPPPDEVVRRQREVLEPHYEYRCERCGYGEIHERNFGEAA